MDIIQKDYLNPSFTVSSGDMKETSLQTILNYLVISTIFMDAFVVTQQFFDMYVFYFIYVGYILYFILRYRNIYLQRSLFFFLSIVVLISLITITIFQLSYVLLIKNIIGILSSACAFFLLFKENNYDIKKLFQVYFNIAFIVACIGFFQLIMYVIGLKFGYDYSSFLIKWRLDHARLGILRLNSLTSEPSHFAIIFAPAVFVIINSIFSKTKIIKISFYQSAVILLAYMLTFSSLAYFAILLSIVIILIKQGYVIPGTKKFITSLLCIIPIFFLIIAAMLHIPEFQRRVTETAELITGEKTIDEVNLSTLTLYSKYVVAKETFKQSPLFGTGLGTYEQDFARHAQKIIPQEVVLQKFGLNRKDAGSLFLRLITETGLFGLIIVLVFFLKNIIYARCRADVRIDSLIVLNNSFIILLVLRFMRMGHYFICGFFFFIFMFYFARKQYKEVMK